MSASPFGAARPRVEIRRRPAELPLPDVHPDDFVSQCDDDRYVIYLEEQAQDRLDDYEGRPWPSGQVRALPLAAGQKAAA